MQVGEDQPLPLICMAKASGGGRHEQASQKAGPHSSIDIIPIPSPTSDINVRSAIGHQ